jgi:hypothetical protein
MGTRSGEIQPFLLAAGLGALFGEQIQSNERHIQSKQIGVLRYEK